MKIFQKIFQIIVFARKTHKSPPRRCYRR